MKKEDNICQAVRAKFPLWTRRLEKEKEEGIWRRKQIFEWRRRKGKEENIWRRKIFVWRSKIIREG